MVQSTVLSTEEMVHSRFRRLEPKVRVSPGNDVDLCAKCRNRKVVKHVFGRHRQLDAAAHRNMKLVYLTLTRLVLHLPHPLLADDVDLHRILGHLILVVVNDRTAEEYRHGYNEREERPTGFQNHRSVDLGTGSKLFLFTIFEREQKDGDDDRDGKSHA